MKEEEDEEDELQKKLQKADNDAYAQVNRDILLPDVQEQRDCQDTERNDGHRFIFHLYWFWFWLIYYL